MNGEQEKISVSFEQKKLRIEIEAELPPKLATAIEAEQKHEQRRGKHLTFDEMALALLEEGIKATEARLAATEEQQQEPLSSP